MTLNSVQVFTTRFHSYKCVHYFRQKLPNLWSRNKELKRKEKRGSNNSVR